MGYCVSSVDCKFKLQLENVENAFKALQNLCSEEIMKGSSVLKNFEDIMLECGWEVEEDEDGNYNQIRFIGDKIYNNEEELRAIAPYVDSGSYIQMVGEDGDTWRYVFNNGTFNEVRLDWSKANEDKTPENQIVYVVQSEVECDGLREFYIEGIYTTLEKAKERMTEVVNNNHEFFGTAENPVYEEKFALSSEDYVEEDWMEISIREEKLF